MPHDLPWFLGGWRRSLGEYGWPRHPVHSPSRSFQSWLGYKGKEGAETRRQARRGQAVSGGRLFGTLKPFSRGCSPVTPGETLPGKASPLTPGTRGESCRCGRGEGGNYPEPRELDDQGCEDQGSAEDAALRGRRREVGMRGCAEPGSDGAVRVQPAPPSSAPAPHLPPPPRAGPSPAPGGPSAQS